MQKLLDEDAAVRDAETLVEQDQAVGTPVLPVSTASLRGVAHLDRAVHQRAARPDDAVHRRIWDQTPVGEAKGKTQEIYALLDTSSRPS